MELDEKSRFDLLKALSDFGNNFINFFKGSKKSDVEEIKAKLVRPMGSLKELN